MAESCSSEFDQYLSGWYRTEIYGPYLRGLAEYLVKALTPANALDIGCARGYLVEAFRSLGVNGVGVDISQEAILTSAVSVQSYLFKVDVTKEELPFSAQSFDLVTCLETLEHLPTAEFTLAQIWRILKPGGHCFITIPTRLTQMPLWGLLFPSDPTHCNMQSRRFWIASFSSAGFEYLGEIPRAQRYRVTRLLRPGSKFGRVLATLHLWYYIPLLRFLPMFRCMSLYRRSTKVGKL